MGIQAVASQQTTEPGISTIRRLNQHRRICIHPYKTEALTTL
ncbi:hypothetical protein SynA1825c_01575 [Synechococcus sp. A18-25c]|nr:hypothetical protein SynA1825c_01575 [Synechococcus sp. A18-25c]